jgi:anaerobic magnesium-protoporphyrin IX monomethyl ester cyclase
MQRVMAELAVIAQLRDKTIKLLDRSFHLGRRRTLELLQAFADTPSGLRFHLELNPDRVSDEALAIFARAESGKFQFEIGLQTLDDGVLSAIDRQMNVARALERIRDLTQLRRHPVHVDLLAGLPDEGFGQCVDALDRTFRLYPDHLQLGVLKLLPGTPLRRAAADFGYRWSDQPPYEILAHRRLEFSQLARLKRYAELLERLWNNGLLCHTLIAINDRYCDGKIHRLFDRLLDGGDELALQRPGPERIFALVVTAWREELERDKGCARLLVWDYLRHTAPSTATPAWIAERIPESRVINTQAGKKRLPVLRLEGEWLAAINRLRSEPLAPGSYGIWPRKHRKGVPLELYPVAE